MPDEDVITPPVNRQAAGETAVAACVGVRDDAARFARFKAVAATREVDGAAFSKLQRYAGAAWYAQHRELQVRAAQRFETVPEGLVTRGTELFERMHRLAVYHFGDDGEEGPRSPR